MPTSPPTNIAPTPSPLDQSPQHALSAQLPGKSMKRHGRAGTTTAARWVNKRAKFDPAKLDKAAALAKDESPISTFNSEVAAILPDDDDDDERAFARDD